MYPMPVECFKFMFNFRPLALSCNMKSLLRVIELHRLRIPGSRPGFGPNYVLTTSLICSQTQTSKRMQIKGFRKITGCKHVNVWSGLNATIVFFFFFFFFFFLKQVLHSQGAVKVSSSAEEYLVS